MWNRSLIPVLITCSKSGGHTASNHKIRGRAKAWLVGRVRPYLEALTIYGYAPVLQLLPVGCKLRVIPVLARFMNEKLTKRFVCCMTFTGNSVLLAMNLKNDDIRNGGTILADIPSS